MFQSENNTYAIWMLNLENLMDNSQLILRHFGSSL